MLSLFKRPKKEPQLVIREATIKDARGIIKLLNSVGREKLYMVSETFNWSEEEEKQLIRNLDRNKDLILVADYGGEIVGCLTLFRYYGGRSPKVQHVGEIGVSIDARFRNIGIGTKLFAEAINWAKSKGYEKLCLSVFSTNEVAIHLYKKFGFEEEGRRRRQFKIGDEYVDEVLMGLFL
ncbi:N-acetyltransferase family protein [Thermoanaerobacter mathranii]|uniref:GNAT family N-acetyltransferase n=1 Tax=Thermoanaerobacter mathranii TaxID=583357 RepID=UPI003D6A07B8